MKKIFFIDLSASVLPVILHIHRCFDLLKSIELSFCSILRQMMRNATIIAYMLRLDYNRAKDNNSCCIYFFLCYGSYCRRSFLLDTD